MGGGAIREDDTRPGGYRGEHGWNLGVGGELQIGLEERGELRWGELHLVVRERKMQRLLGDRPKVDVAPHQRAQPGIFQLLCSPEATQSLGLRGDGLEGGDHGVHVKQGPIGIKDKRLGGDHRSSLRHRCVLPSDLWSIPCALQRLWPAQRRACVRRPRASVLPWRPTTSAAPWCAMRVPRASQAAATTSTGSRLALSIVHGWYHSADSSRETAISRYRSHSSPSASFASSRASGAPTQKWMPCPKVRCWLGTRWMSNRSGSGNCVASRLAEAIHSRMIWLAAITCPLSSTSVAVRRASRGNGGR